MSSVHEGCLQGKSVRDREGSKHSTAAALERVYSEAAVLPQDFEDTVHARQLKALCRRVGRRMSRQGPGRSPSI
jgi:glycerol-3-phosphate O-acyltransferase